MADEQQFPTFGKQDILPSIILGLLTKDPLAYPKWKTGMHQQRLDNLWRQAQMKRFEQQEAEAERPASLPIIEKKQIPSGGIGTLESGEIPQYDVPTETREQIGVSQVPVPGYKMKDLHSLSSLHNLYNVLGLGPKKVAKTEAYGHGQRRDLATGEIINVPTAPEKEVPRRTVWKTAEEAKKAGTEAGIPRGHEVTAKSALGGFDYNYIQTPAGEKPPKPQRVSAQYESWEKTIDRRLKQIGAKYKLTDKETIDISGRDMGALVSLFTSKGLSADSAKKYLDEIGELDSARVGGLQDIDAGKDPYKRLKDVGKGLGEKSSVSPKLVEESISKFAGLPVPGAKAESIKVQKASVFKRKDGTIYAKMPDGTELEGELKEGKFIPKR